MSTLIHQFNTGVDLVWYVFTRVVAVCTAITLGMRAIPARHFEAIERWSPRLGHALSGIRALAADVVKFARAVRKASQSTPPPAGRSGRPLRTVPRDPASTPRQDAPPPTARYGFAALAVLAFALAGCNWRNAPADCTSPGAFECQNNRPYQCMSNRVLMPVREACGDAGVCVLTTGVLYGSAVAACVATTSSLADAGATDGGTP